MRDVSGVSRGITASAEPCVALSSLARSSIPGFSDHCLLELSEGVGELFRVGYPAGEYEDPASGSRLAGNTLRTAFEAPSGLGYPAYAGVLYHSWLDRQPADEDAVIARLLVDLALSQISQERLAQSMRCSEDRAAKLALDVISSRCEGEAIGILSARHGVRRDEVLWLLRRVSRETHRDLSEVAAAVVHAGDLDWPSAPWASSPDGKPRLEPAASLPGLRHRRSSARAPGDRQEPRELLSRGRHR